MKFSAAVVLAAAIGASAHPSNHGHRHAHRSVQAREFVMAKKPAPPPPSTTTPPPPATSSAAPSSAPAPVANNNAAVAPSSASSPSPSPSSGGYIPFCQGQKRATLAQIAYAGNTGGSVYGCNIMKISADIASLYDYTAKFVNQGSSLQKCYCWNKIGPDGGINGFFKSNDKALTFDLAAHGQQYVAFDKNSQVGCACHPDPFPFTLAGAFASTWFEGDFCNESNNQYSGFDASSIVSAAAGLDIPGLQVCGDGTCSTIYPGGKGDNAFVGGTEAMDGIGGNIRPGPLALTITVDYSS